MSRLAISRSCQYRIARCFPLVRSFSTTHCRHEILDLSTLPDRISPKYKESSTSSLLSLQWPEPPRNILIIPKLLAPKVTASAASFASHIHNEYPKLNLVFERRVASTIHESLPFPIYTSDPTHFPNKIDLVTTLGGDGTILRAASLFSLHSSVPPILSFSMGTLGFLGEWKFEEYKRAWREVYMSGSRVAVADLQDPHTQVATNSRSDEDEGDLHSSWGGVRGKSMGLTRSSKILLRHRLKVGIYDAAGVNVNEQLMPTSTAEPQQSIPKIPDLRHVGGVVEQPLASRQFHAVNELVIHRGPNPHLAIIDVYVNNHFLTEAVADGILISTPTGSTAYSLSAGGSIMHPLVKTLLITPICARSLSFRPLGLPLNTKVVLKLSEKNRGREIEVSIDGKRRAGVTIGMEIRVEGEAVGRTPDGSWAGGVPCVIRSPSKADGDRDGIAEDDDGWVGGLIGLLKFNYPFGEGQ
ncbi:ATP-NAD kinase [Annulohypoxylon maeteangense]|uniref:ATP-NAD kinase n=1 Tax=Annulohypoxylon maeteangense TaxID=1927788 RepID=UPI00200745B4|nr:ATP-NAD kinase [Annulohypoxylon maeteangense]KAI0879909.1 ATP-NAD kinase [Annulohypoxylon maeteangense]